MNINKSLCLHLMIISIITILLSSCATMQSIPSSKRTKVFNTDYLTTFKAVISYCNDRSFAITMADKDLGIVNTDFKENEGTSKFFFGNYRSKLNFSIRQLSESTTQVLINASAEKQGAFGTWTQTTMTENQATDLYHQIFSGIGNNLPGFRGKPKSENDKNSLSNEVNTEISSFTLVLKSDEPKTIFSGRASLTYISSYSGKSTLYGKGIWGFSQSKSGTFSDSSIKLSKGESFYVQVDENTVFEITVVQEIYSIITLNFTKQ